MVLYVTISMESAPANQIFLVTSVTNVLMDNMNFPSVMVSFCYPLCLRRSHISILHMSVPHILAQIFLLQLTSDWNSSSTHFLDFTAIPYRASTGPEQAFPCVVFPQSENPVFITGFPVDENRFFPVGNTTQGKPCFHYRDGFAVYYGHKIS